MIKTPTIGDQLEDLLKAASSEVVICAPFITRGALLRALEHVTRGATLEVFTRWRPEEVAAGVSDPGALIDVEAKGGTMLLCDRLHAKLYQADSAVLIGSANVTGAALGWSPAPNLEILAPASRSDPPIAQLLEQLKSEAVAASPSLMEEVLEAASAFKVPPAPPELEEEPAMVWLPRLRMPEDLYLAYTRGARALATDSGEAAAYDLATLDLPLGLDKNEFRRLVRLRLLHRREFRDLDEYLRTPRRFGEGRAYVQEHFDLDRTEAEGVWQTLMRWLLYFMPNQYGRAVPRHTEMIVRRGVAD